MTWLMNKKIIMWTVAPLIATVAFFGLANSNVSSEFCGYLPFRCALGVFASGIGGTLVIAPAVAVIAGIWFLFSKKRYRLPLVIAWSFFVLAILVLVVSGQVSISK